MLGSINYVCFQNNTIIIVSFQQSVYKSKYKKNYYYFLIWCFLVKEIKLNLVWIMSSSLRSLFQKALVVLFTVTFVLFYVMHEKQLNRQSHEEMTTPAQITHIDRVIRCITGLIHHFIL